MGCLDFALTPCMFAQAASGHGGFHQGRRAPRAVQERGCGWLRDAGLQRVCLSLGPVPAVAFRELAPSACVYCSCSRTLSISKFNRVAATSKLVGLKHAHLRTCSTCGTTLAPTSCSFHINKMQQVCFCVCQATSLSVHCSPVYREVNGSIDRYRCTHLYGQMDR
jgi:hypothetical protein